MKLEEIYEPIENKIQMMRDEIEWEIGCVEEGEVRKILEYFFSKRGKYLRPALVFLSADSQRTPSKWDKNLARLGMVMEMIHSASLIHDDILDGDLIRRGQSTISETYGQILAVLIGDLLFAEAYSILSSEFGGEYSEIVSRMSVEMCSAEIEQAKDKLNREEYLRVIKGKTALFTGVCCKLGAMFAGADEKDIEALYQYGINFGMAYQIKDDFSDKDRNALENITVYESDKYSDRAVQALSQIEESVYKEKLIDLVRFI